MKWSSRKSKWIKAAIERITADAIDAKRNNRYSVTSFITTLCGSQLTYVSTLGLLPTGRFLVLHLFIVFLQTAIERIVEIYYN